MGINRGNRQRVRYWTVYLGFAEKAFPGGRVWGVGFYPFSGGQLPNFQGKSTWIFPPITPKVGTFWGKTSLKTLSNKVFRFIQQTLVRSCQRKPNTRAYFLGEWGAERKNLNRVVLTDPPSPQQFVGPTVLNFPPVQGSITLDKLTQMC